MCAVRTASVTCFVQEDANHVIGWWIVRRNFDDVSGELWDENLGSRTSNRSAFSAIGRSCCQALGGLSDELDEATATL